MRSSTAQKHLSKKIQPLPWDDYLPASASRGSVGVNLASLNRRGVSRQGAIKSSSVMAICRSTKPLCFGEPTDVCSRRMPRRSSSSTNSALTNSVPLSDRTRSTVRRDTSSIDVGCNPREDHRYVELAIHEICPSHPRIVFDDHHQVLYPAGRRRPLPRWIHEQAFQRPGEATPGRPRNRHPPALLRTPRTRNQLSETP